MAKESFVNRELLFARVPKPTVGQSGIAEQDVARARVDDAVVGELLACLNSNDPVDVTFGLFFAQGLRQREEFLVVAEPQLPTIAAGIRAALNHTCSQVRQLAVEAFAAFHQSYDDYPTRMREFLRSQDAGIRRAALRAAPSFLLPSEVEALLSFRADPEFGETGGMGGPLRYDIRDYALAVAEHIAGRRFDSGDCFERRDGMEISWRSWASFTQWLETRKPRRFFGR